MIMSGMNGYLGFKGWQWVFLIEGLPTVLVGYLLYKILPDKPRVAPWLSSHEKDVVEMVLAADREGETGGHHHGKLKAALADSKTWILAFVYFTIAAGVYTLTFWLPTMIKALPGVSIAQVGWYVVPPFACGALGILAITNSSDRLRERRWHVALPMIIGTLCLFATTFPVTCRRRKVGRRLWADDDPALRRIVSGLRRRRVVLDNPADLSDR
jgi:sugar phosphate permease